MRAVLISIQPYWVFLIIAKTMGWNINEEKTVEIRKSRPRADGWNRVTKIYCSKDKNSFAQIPKQYQPLMQQFLGKVIGEFVCDDICEYTNYSLDEQYGHIKRRENLLRSACMTLKNWRDYVGIYRTDFAYAWHISKLIIYDKPKELSEFRSYNVRAYYDEELKLPMPTHEIIRPPQSWYYVEEGSDTE